MRPIISGAGWRVCPAAVWVLTREYEFDAAQSRVAMPVIPRLLVDRRQIIDLRISVAVVEAGVAFIPGGQLLRAFSLVQDAQRVLVWGPAAIAALVQQQIFGDLNDLFRAVVRGCGVPVAGAVLPMFDTVGKTVERDGLVTGCGRGRDCDQQSQCGQG
jgi:hypothetical protein